MMKRLVFLMTAMFVVCMAMAVDMSHLRQIGLPAKAVPASLYFENIMSNTPRTMTAQDIANCGLSGLDNEYFFFVEQLPTSPDDLYACINLWMYDAENDKVDKIFSQQGEEYKELLVKDITWLLDKKYSFKDVEVSDTKQIIGMQEFTSSPVVVLEAEIFTGFMHAPQMTLLVYPESKKVQKLENEMLVTVSHTLTNMLMAAEMEYGQDFIITTSTDMHSEPQDLKGSEEYIIFNKQYLTPTIHVYSARGKLLGSLVLPEEEVDMIR